MTTTEERIQKQCKYERRCRKQNLKSFLELRRVENTNGTQNGHVE
jgi:hypothetical protein